MFKYDLDEYIAVLFFFGVPIGVFCAIAYLFSFAHAIALLLTLLLFLIII